MSGKDETPARNDLDHIAKVFDDMDRAMRDASKTRHKSMPVMSNNRLPDVARLSAIPAAARQDRLFDIRLDDDGDEDEKKKKIVYTPEDEQQVVRKFDLHIMVYLCVVHCVGSMVTYNIGNAYTAGMTIELSFNDRHFADILNLYNVAHLLFLWTVAAWTFVRPRLFMPWVIILWGVLGSYQSIIAAWSQIMALRFLLGMLQAVTTHGLLVYLCWFYFMKEASSRIIALQAMYPLACFFNGLIGYASTHGDINPTISPWRVILLSSSLPAIVVGLCGFWGFPDSGQSCRFLDEDQQRIAQSRSALIQDPKTSFSFISMIFFTLILFCINVSTGSLPVFMPTMIQSTHITTSSRAQLLTSPPYVVAFLMMVTLACLSSKINYRGVVLCCVCLIGAVGYSILAAPEIVNHDPLARYGAMFLIAPGIFMAKGTMILWISQNISYYTQVVSSLLYIMGDLGVILGNRMFPHSSIYYQKGCFLCAGFMYAAAILSALHVLFLIYKNRQLKKQFSDSSSSYFQYLL